MAPAGYTLAIAFRSLAYKRPFAIHGHTASTAAVVLVTISDGIHIGRGEADGVSYHGETSASIAAAIESVQPLIEARLEREALQDLLPPGGARNAIDCALWELKAQQAGRPVWSIAGLQPPRPLLTTYTIGADAADVMAAMAQDYAAALALKLKLTGDVALDAARVAAVRAARPEAWLGVDFNQGSNRSDLLTLLDILQANAVRLIEQPFPIGAEAWLDGLGCPIPIALDESIQSRRDLPLAVGRCQVVNIKLDKAGGLTEALAMASEARRLGLDVMVGNMGGSSLAMAPAIIVGQLCDIVDIDGPILLKDDIEPFVTYAGGHVSLPADSWGSGRR